MSEKQTLRMRFESRELALTFADALGMWLPFGTKLIRKGRDVTLEFDREIGSSVLAQVGLCKARTRIVPVREWFDQGGG